MLGKEIPERRRRRRDDYARESLAVEDESLREHGWHCLRVAEEG